MNILNVEFKAKVKSNEAAEQKLLALNPVYIGEDHQIDTYFNVADGRLKLREGNIENSLIWYKRENAADAKQSDIILYKHEPAAALKNILTKVHGVKVVVDKRRRIYFMENVKFHFDTVRGLGEFMEVEAIDETGMIGSEKLREQCDYYAAFFGIASGDFLQYSYSDMLL
jgi:adenylate cyclase class 2